MKSMPITSEKYEKSSTCQTKLRESERHLKTFNDSLMPDWYRA